MAGIEVTRSNVDIRTSDTIIALRNAFDQVEHIESFLVNNPADGAADPLVDKFSYTADEAYMIRLVFQQLNDLRKNNQSIFDTASKLTGLE